MAIYTQLKAANISTRDSKALLKGKIPPFKPSKQYLKKEIKARSQIMGPEEAELITQRRKLIFEFAKERYQDSRAK